MNLKEIFISRYNKAIFGLVIFSFITTFSVARAENTTNVVFPADSKPYGTSLPEWTVKWWQWFLAIPQNNHPMNDESGRLCGVNQENQNAWFLTTAGSGTVERTCAIPAGKAILSPVAANECSYAEFPNLKTEAELRNCAVSGDEVSSIAASIDGVAVNDIRKYRIQSPLFNATLAENNVFGAPAGETEAVSDMFVLFLQPLSPGKHELRLSQTTLDNPTTGTQSFAYDVIYHLVVGQNSTKSPAQ
ncbi:MAG TPA: hypothetical protein VF884_10830 [Nitrososphaeraceae archaeon]